jgi:adenine-specific DNA glycosylase
MQQLNLPNMSEKLEFVENYLLTHDYLEQQRKEIKHNFSHFKSELKRRWITAHKKEDSFIAKNSAWLKRDIYDSDSSASTGTTKNDVW